MTDKCGPIRWTKLIILSSDQEIFIFIGYIYIL